MGGLFYFNYPGGTGLTSGAVFGKVSGTSAGRDAVEPELGEPIADEMLVQ